MLAVNMGANKSSNKFAANLNPVSRVCNTQFMHGRLWQHVQNNVKFVYAIKDLRFVCKFYKNNVLCSKVIFKFPKVSFFLIYAY